jgi:hypothetical protein
MIIVFKLTIFNYYFISQPPDRFNKVDNCVNYKIKLKQSNFERNAKTIFHRKYANRLLMVIVD